MITRAVTLTLLILMFSSVSFGLYFIVDYFMDHGIPKAFGQSCDEYIHDHSAYVQSHINTFGDFDYRGHVRCKTTLDAGSKPGATWKIKWLRFKVEATTCGDDDDYLEFYDMSLHWYDRLRKRDPFMGRFCGWTYPPSNLMDNLTQQYLTLIWHTNGHNEDRGWRLMATRVWPEHNCPGDNYMRCKAENICMVDMLKCDGIQHCDDGSDEENCEGWQILIGGFLALGTAGVTAISLVLTFVYVCLFFLIRFIIKKLRKKKEGEVVIIDTGGEKGEGDKDGGKDGRMAEMKAKLNKAKKVMKKKFGNAKKAAIVFINRLRGKRPNTPKTPKKKDGDSSDSDSSSDEDGVSTRRSKLPTYEEAAALKTVNETPRGGIKTVNKTPDLAATQATALPGRPQSGVGGTVSVGLAGLTSPRDDGATGGQGDITHRSRGSVSVAPVTKK